MHNYLLSNFKKISGYFPSNSSKWKNKFQKAAISIDHDEPWLTLISIYALFGEKPYSDDAWDAERFSVNGLNYILKNSGMTDCPVYEKITEVKLEKHLPEILSYRDKLRETYQECSYFHLYPDINKAAKKKLSKTKASFEGNTNLDLLIEGIADGKKTNLFIEAKFNSDISYKITYNSVRDQIARNIDAAIETTDTQNEDFRFLLLTPHIFRTKQYGGGKSVHPINLFEPEKSRLYCYKMDDYKSPYHLAAVLPHRKENWDVIVKKIGWITFEQFYQAAEKRTDKDANEWNKIKIFFKERGLD